LVRAPGLLASDSTSDDRFCDVQHVRQLQSRNEFGVERAAAVVKGRGLCAFLQIA
jgi:hypothetical protein